MKPVKDMSLGELAAFVWTHLDTHGIHCILSGGACVSIYTDNQYLSYDLDFIETGFSDRKDIVKTLQNIGFHEENRYFRHPEASFILEFPTGPPALGTQPVIQSSTKEFETGRLAMLSPTDCIKDRLAAYYHWNDKQCLDQAIMVAKNHDIDLSEIRSWSEKEGMLSEFDRIRDQFSASPETE